jgi:hypothetical protein
MRLILAPLLLALAACDGTTGKDDTEDTNDTDEPCTGDCGPLTCDWFAGENCWKDGIVEAAACLPGGTATFSGDRASCEYADGTTVTFGEAVPTSDPGMYAWQLEVTDASDAFCASFAVTPDGYEIVSASGTVEMIQAGYDEDVVCQDATEVHSDNALGLQECDPATVPGTLTDWAGGTFTFSISGGPATGGFEVVCSG